MRLPTTDWNRCERCGICADACFADAREQIGREMTVDAVLAEIERDVAFYDESGGGVTLTGGEPLAQHAFTLALLAGVQGAGDSHRAGHLRVRVVGRTRSGAALR